MAVDSSSASKQSVSRNEKINSPQKKESKSQKPSGSVENFVISSPSRRNKSPGVWLMGGRIYDPVNGKTCHQEAAVSPRKRGKENSFDGKVDANLLNPIGMKSKEAKTVKNGNIDNDATLKRIGNKGKIMQEQPEEIRHHRGIIDVLTRENGSASRDKKAKKTKRDRSDGMNNRTGDKVNLKENEVLHDIQFSPKDKS